MLGSILLAELLSRATAGFSVAVVGGGVAGTTTVLDLLANSDVSRIVIYENGASLGHNKSASGIISASVQFTPSAQYWNTVTDWKDIFEYLNIVSVTDSARFTAFLAENAAYKFHEDVRTKEAYQSAFFDASRQRMEEILDLYPTLCPTISGPFCCRNGSAARAWVDANPDAMKYHNCSSNTGWYHAFQTVDQWAKAYNAPIAAQGGWGILNASTLQSQIPGLLQGDAVLGGLFQADDGFVYVEDFYPAAAAIFAASGKVDLRTGCKVQTLQKAAPDAKITLTSSCETTGYDRVIVTAGAYSHKLADTIDISTLSFPVKGYSLISDNVYVPAVEQRGLGVEWVELEHYVRPNQADGRVHYGFGKVVDTFDDELLDPTWDSRWNPDTGADKTTLGAALLNSNRSQRLAGFRPVSAFGNFPLLVALGGDQQGVVINTGFGWNGYTLAWKSAQLAVDLAVNGQIQEAQWVKAVLSGVLNLSPAFLPLASLAAATLMIVFW